MGNRTVVMYWDCDYCGTKNISGLTRVCPYCGKPRGTETNFHFIEGKEKEYIDEDKAEEIGREPDWLCSFCSSLNNAKETTCPSCGASREDSSKNYFEMKEEREAKKREAELLEVQRDEERKLGINYEEFEKEYFANREEKTVSETKTKWSLKNYIARIGIILSVIALGLLIFLPKTKSVHVDSHNWEYSINVEEYKTFSESDWTLPPGARLTSQQVEFKEYVPVLDHYETQTVTEQSYEQIGSHTEYSYVDNGNGTATEVAHTVPDYGYVTHTRTEQVPVYRQEPVYATKYYYDIDRWTYTRSIKTEGNDTKPYWGELDLKDKEREQSRNEKYTVNCTDVKKGKEYSYDAPYEIWIAIKDGSDVKLTVKLGKITEFK